MLFVFGKKFGVHEHKVVDLLLWFTEFVSGCAFPENVIDGIIAITNNNGDSASPGNMPPWMLISVFSSSCQFSLVFSINLLTSPGILHILRLCNIQLLGIILYGFLLSIQAIARFFLSCFTLMEDVLIYIL